MKEQKIEQPEKALIAIADTHGHLDILLKLLRKIEDTYEEYDLVFMGDYCDNGPQIKELLDFLIEFIKKENVYAILGNHDLACIRSLGYPQKQPDPIWFSRWGERYWDFGGSTAFAYEAYSAQELQQKMPKAHQDFLLNLPWVLEFRDHVFVHSGMEIGPLEPQILRLKQRVLPLVRTHLPPQIRDKDLSALHDPNWTKTVVSAHNKRPTGVLGKSFFAPKRVCIAADVDRQKCLRAVELVSRTELTAQ